VDFLVHALADRQDAYPRDTETRRGNAVFHILCKNCVTGSYGDLHTDVVTLLAGDIRLPIERVLVDRTG